jgi:hypothetical protein
MRSDVVRVEGVLRRAIARAERKQDQYTEQLHEHNQSYQI